VLAKGARLVAGIVTSGNSTGDLWLFDLSRGSSTRFTSSRDNKSNAVWAPDDQRILFGVGVPVAARGVYEEPTDLIGDAKRFAGAPRVRAVSPAGRTTGASSARTHPTRVSAPFTVVPFI
jgi:Tol biopolymer transport system component